MSEGASTDAKTSTSSSESKITKTHKGTTAKDENGKEFTRTQTRRLIASAISKASKKYQRNISGLFVDSILDEIPREKINRLSPNQVWDALYEANAGYQRSRMKYEPEYRAEHYSLDEVNKALSKASGSKRKTKL